jgi:hypothetical protein
MHIKKSPTETPKEAQTGTEESGFWEWFQEFEKKLKIN